jgi:putative transposase
VKTVEGVELARLGWAHWHNTRRLYGYLSDQSPVEYEQTFYAAHSTDQITVGNP